MGLTIAAAVGCLFVLWIHGRLNERAAGRDWVALFGRGRGVYLKGRENIDADLAVLRLSYATALEMHRLGSVEEAVRVLGIAYDVLVETSASMTRLLKGMGTLSRMVSAFTPIPPVDPAPLRVAQLAHLASIAAVLHVFLVSAAERFRLRVYVLWLGFGAIARYMLRSTRRLEAEPRADSPAWAEIEALQADFHTLTDETVESLRLLLLSAEKARQLR
jgi:hypothetical protein